MENATKALIIAAAILIAIVLISLGVFVLGQGSTMVQENSDMSAEQVSAYNAEWEAYLGNKVSATKVKQLINAVNTHNSTINDDSKKITLVSEGPSNTTITITKPNDDKYTNDNIKAGLKYNIVLYGGGNGYTSAGLIKKINITIPINN